MALHVSTGNGVDVTVGVEDAGGRPRWKGIGLYHRESQTHIALNDPQGLVDVLQAEIERVRQDQAG